MAFTLGFLSLFGFLDVGVPFTDDSDKLLFGLAGSSDSLINIGFSKSSSTDLPAISVIERGSMPVVVMVVMVVAAVEVVRLLATEVVTEVRLPSRDSIIVTVGEPVMGASATTNSAVL